MKQPTSPLGDTSLLVGTPQWEMNTASNCEMLTAPTSLPHPDQIEAA